MIAPIKREKVSDLSPQAALAHAEVEAHWLRFHEATNPPRVGAAKRRRLGLLLRRAFGDLAPMEELRPEPFDRLPVCL